MEKTPFAGLSVLEPDESIYADNSAFITRDRSEIDRALQIGVKTHRHTGLPGLSNPQVAPSGQIVGSGGTIPSGISLTLGYTLEDAVGGETQISATTLVTTPSPFPSPSVAPVAVADYTEGELDVDTFTYAVTFGDGEGGETPIGPTVTVTREPGFGNAQIKLSGLNVGMEEAGASEWRLYRARSGGEYNLLTTGTGGTFNDDGTTLADCDVHPPTSNVNTTGDNNQLLYTIPGSAAVGSAATWINLYASQAGDFAESCLLMQVPIGSAGVTVLFDALELLDAQPPDVNRSYGDAGKIDPDTELIDWHWKRPVDSVEDLPEDAEEGDVRAILDAEEPTFYMFLDGEWQLLDLGGDGAGTIKEVSIPIGFDHYFRDDFLVDSIAAEEWESLLEDLTISEGFLQVAGNANDYLTRIEEPDEFEDAVAEGHFRRIGAWSGNLWIGLKHQHEAGKLPKNYVAMRIRPSFISIIKVDGGVTTVLKEEEAITFSANTDYWYRFKTEGNKLVAEWWSTDPSLGGSPAKSMEVTLEGEDATQFGTGVEGKFLYRVEGVDATKSARTDYLQVSPLDDALTLVTNPERLHVVPSGGIRAELQEDPAGVAELLLEGPAAMLADEGMGVIVIPTSEKGIARPSNFKQYTWFCKEEPTNLAEFDIWIEAGP